MSAKHEKAENKGENPGSKPETVSASDKDKLIGELRSQVAFLETELKSRQDDHQARTGKRGGLLQECEPDELTLQKQAALLNLSPDGIMARKPDGRITFWSNGAEELYGWTGQEAIGKRTHSLFKTRFPCRFTEIERELRETGRWSGELIHTTKEGREITVRSRWLAQLDDKGHVAEILESNVDITERARVEEALRESVERLQQAQQVARIGTFEWNIRTGVNTWTPELEAMYGLPPGGFPGMEEAWEQLVHPEDRPEAVRRVNEAMETGGFEGEWRVVWPDGTVHWLHGRGFVFRDESGTPLKLIGVNIDITERKQMEEELRRGRDELEARVRERTAELSESEERFRQLAENSPIPMAINDKDDNITYLNKKFTEIFGYTLADIPHLSCWWRLAYPDPVYREEAIKRWEKGVEEAVKGSKEIGPIDYTVTCKDGSVRHAEISGAPVGDKELVLLQDVTERKRTEEALRESEHRFREVFEQAPLGIVLVDSITGRFLQVNQKYCDIVGLSREEILATDYQSITHRDDLQESVDNIDRMLRGEIKSYNLEKRYVHENGSIVWVNLTVVPLWDAGSKYKSHIAMVEDITERKHAEEALRESERNLAQAQAISHVGNWYLDPVTQVGGGSDEFYHILGIPRRDQITFSEFLGFIHPDDRPLVRGSVDAVMSTHELPRIDVQIVRPDGEERTIFLIGHFALDEEGRPCTFGTMQDITERKQAEEALKRSKAALARAHDIARLNSWIVNFETDELEVSDQAFKNYGYDVGEIKPTISLYLSHIHPDDRKKVEGYLERMRMGERGSVDYRIVRRDGSTIIMNSIIDGFIRDHSGRVIRAYGIGQDITERKRAEEELRVSEANLVRAQRITRLGNWTWDVKCDRVEGSTEFFRMFGFGKRQYIVYDEFLARLYPEDRELVDKAVQAALSGMVPYSIDYRIVLPDGVMRVIHAEGEVTRDNLGQPATMFGTVQDVTERKRNETELGEAKARAELYLDLMGHDINNMNQSAIGFLELALQTLETDGKIGRNGKLFIEKPLQAVQSSSKLISNVRKLQRLTDEGIKTMPVDLHDLFEELKAHDYDVDDRDAIINVPAVPHYLVEGSDLLRDVFFNLISNAVKHSEPDRPVTIDAGVERVDQDGQAYYRCTVEDNGPGVPDQLKPKLFHRFQRGKTQAYGKGLGLYLVRTLIEGYHGKVWAEDRVPGDHTKGARFVIMLPAVDK